MRRAIYEWTAIFAATVAVCCLGVWVFSWFSRAADVDTDFVLGKPGALYFPRASLVDGNVEFFSDAGNLGAVLSPASYFRDGLTPLVTQHTLFGRPYCVWTQEATGPAHGLRLSAVGVTYAYCDVIDFDNSPLFVWQVRASLLWPFALASVVAILATRRYRAARRQMESQPETAAA